MAAAAAVLEYLLANLPLLCRPQVIEGGLQAYRRRLVNVRDGVCSSGDGLSTASAAPNSNGTTLDGYLAAESAGILGVLCDFHLLDLLSQRGTISGKLRACQSIAIKPKYPRLAPKHRSIRSSPSSHNQPTGCAGLRGQHLARPGTSSSSKKLKTLLVPYLPVAPTFLVRFDILTVCGRGRLVGCG
jgi:hypothetical protein